MFFVCDFCPLCENMIDPIESEHSNEEPKVQNSSHYSDEEIDIFCSEAKFNPLPTDYIRFLSQEIFEHGLIEPKLDERLKNIISGENLVDLGCGRSAGVFGREEDLPKWKFPPAVRMAKHWGAKRYLGVDPYQKTDDTEDIQGVIEYGSKISGIETNFIEEEMLKFVHRQPDQSNCYLIVGVDKDIITSKDSYSAPSIYVSALIEELYRTTSSPGVVISYPSKSIILKSDLMEQAGFKAVRPEQGDLDLIIWFKE